MSEPTANQIKAWLRSLPGSMSAWSKRDEAMSDAVRALIKHGPEVGADTIRGSLTISISEMKQARFPDDILDSLMADWRNKFVQALREAGVGVKEEK